MALKIIGAGLGRTGTLSLKLALEHLGFGPCYHMLEIMSAGRERMPQWLQVVRGTPDWDAIFEGFASTVDYPTCTYWRELAAHYPEAKVILSTRDAEGWFDSVHRTIFAPEHIDSLSDSPVSEFMQGAVTGAFGDHINEREYMVEYFRRWEEDVTASLPPERLLVHRLGESWEPICDFLGVPVPDQPYPRVNTSEDMLGNRDTRENINIPEEAEARMRGYLDAMRDKAFGD
ncbi:MAG: sulfotransferase [Novosphingobium sp.]|nr:sulfotransferase [Novosphingobium sp.]